MEIRLARLESAYERIDRRLVELRQDLDRHFAAIDQRFASIDLRFASIDQRFAGVDQRFVSVDHRFVSIDRRFADIDKKLSWIVGLIIATWTTTILTVLFHR
jgi:hypothetical protein